MDILRRNSDYAMRAMVQLARNYGQQAISSRELSDLEDIPSQLASKLLQQLAKAGLVESSMGVNGGFSLAGKPEEITAAEVIEAIQGPILVNRCIAPAFVCSRKQACGVHDKLMELQRQMEDYLGGLTLAELAAEAELKETGKKKQCVAKKSKKRKLKAASGRRQ